MDEIVLHKLAITIKNAVIHKDEKEFKKITYKPLKTGQ